MSKNYCAQQFEDAFLPKHMLYNGPIKEGPDHPNHQTAPTRFIANEQGHLVEAQDRNPGNNPFGHFHGTWEEPCHNPGNNAENTINRSDSGANYLRKEKILYDALIREKESKHDFVSEQKKKEMAGIK